MRLVDCPERSDIPWCAIGGVAVNHWAEEPMVTQDVDFVVASGDVERAVEALCAAGFGADGINGPCISRVARGSAFGSAQGSHASHPGLWEALPDELKGEIDRPPA